MSSFLAILITLGVIVIGFFVAFLATIPYSDSMNPPNLYYLYRKMKERSEMRNRPFDYVDFNDFLERNRGIKIGSEQYNQLKKAGEFEDLKSVNTQSYLWFVWIGYLLTCIVLIVYTLSLIF